MLIGPLATAYYLAKTLLRPLSAEQLGKREMKLKQLEGLLGNLDQFSDPKIELEQYPTGPHIASRMLYTAENSFGDISDKVVADFGCGCGTLGLAAALLSADHVIGFDVDSVALEIASSNAEDLELDVDLVQCDIRNLEFRGKIIDTVVMNPPFGTRSKGADMVFLSVALKNASQAVYSLHKTTTRDHVRRAALRDFNAKSAEVLCELRYDVPQLYKFHKKKEVDIAVDLWRFVPAAAPGTGVRCC
uniref:Methyltransferase-like protein 5 n=1 Tax=Opuntia streptacantha TaxID=393608 RepID=A0A7C8YGI6_OPUST